MVSDINFISQNKKIISKAKQVQQNRQRINRQNRQTQQKDARQNIVNKRRGMQVRALYIHIYIDIQFLNLKCCIIFYL